MLPEGKNLGSLKTLVSLKGRDLKGTVGSLKIDLNKNINNIWIHTIYYSWKKGHKRMSTEIMVKRT
jgi:hypothetical protein